jgi:uncharacterized protein YciI
MPYFIETFDRPNHGHVRQAHRPQHLAYLEANKAKLLACGAKLTDDGEAALGGVYLVDVETRAEAERFIAEDPFTKADLFLRIEITRWRKAYLDGRNYL